MCSVEQQLRKMSLVQVWQELHKTTMFFSPILISLLLAFSIFFLFKKLTKGSTVNSPPSPPRLPIIGNLHQLGRSLHRSLQALSDKYGPLMILHMGSVPVLVVSSAEVAREIFKTHDTIFTNRPQIKAADVLFFEYTDVAFSPCNEYWRQVKKICVLELLSLKRVQSFQFEREDEVAELVEKIRRSCVSGSSVNIWQMMVTISSNMITRSVLGRHKYEGESGNAESFGEISRSAIEIMGAFCFEDVFPYLGWMDTLTGFNGRLRKISGKLHAFFDQVIDEHQIPKSDNDETDKKDFVDILLHLQKNMPEINLTRDNIKAILTGMFVAAADTSATTMEWAMAELAKNPTIMKKAQEEVRRVVGEKSKVDEADVNQMDYLKCVIKETLRLHSPSVIARETNASVTLAAGYDIPPKTTVLINTWAIQRDPKSWDRPTEFLPERFSNDPFDFKGQDPRFCPFGSGRRVCPGISFAVIEIEYVVANLLYWFDWGLPGGAPAEDLDMDDVTQEVTRKKIPLTLLPVLHTP